VNRRSRRAEREDEVREKQSALEELGRLEEWSKGRE